MKVLSYESHKIPLIMSRPFFFPLVHCISDGFVLAFVPWFDPTLQIT